MKNIFKALLIFLLSMAIVLSITACANDVTTIEITSAGSVEVNVPLTLTAKVKVNDVEVEAPVVTWTVAEKGDSNTGAAITEGNILTAANAGTCIVTATVGTATKTMDITITEAVPEVPTVTAVNISGEDNLIYGGGTSTYTAEVVGTNGPLQTVTWTIDDYNADTSAASINSETGVLTIAKAGNVTIKATSTADTTKSATKSITIAKATILLTGLNNATNTYSGEPHSFIVAADNITGAVGEDTLSASDIAVEYYSDSTHTQAVLDTNVINAATYYIKVVSTNPNYTIASGNEFTMTINPANQTLSEPVSVVEFDNESIKANMVVGAEYKLISGSSTEGFDESTGWQDSSEFTGLTDLETYIIAARLKGDSNRNPSNVAFTPATRIYNQGAISGVAMGLGMLLPGAFMDTVTGDYTGPTSINELDLSNEAHFNGIALINMLITSLPSQFEEAGVASENIDTYIDLTYEILDISGLLNSAWGIEQDIATWKNCYITYRQAYIEYIAEGIADGIKVLPENPNDTSAEDLNVLKQTQELIEGLEILLAYDQDAINTILSLLAANPEVLTITPDCELADIKINLAIRIQKAYTASLKELIKDLPINPAETDSGDLQALLDAKELIAEIETYYGIDTASIDMILATLIADPEVEVVVPGCTLEVIKTNLDARIAKAQEDMVTGFSAQIAGLSDSLHIGRKSTTQNSLLMQIK